MGDTLTVGNTDSVLRITAQGCPPISSLPSPAHAGCPTPDDVLARSQSTTVLADPLGLRFYWGRSLGQGIFSKGS